MNGSIVIPHPSKASINGLDAIKVLMELGILDTRKPRKKALGSPGKINVNWLVVSNILYFSIIYIYIGNNHPN